jgi:hypothetical protein
MALINQGGKLLLQNGALASGAGCCCSKCSGPCDAESPCPEGCVCVDGECVPNCNSEPCVLVPDFSTGLFAPAVACQGDACCCEGIPHGSCLDDSVIIDENGNPDKLEFKAYCENCCENKLLFSCSHFLASERDRAREWVENVRDHLLANGWGNATEYHFDCYSQGSPDPIAKSYVRVCCDGTVVCPATEEDCAAAGISVFAPADTSNLEPILTSAANCFAYGSVECLPSCEPNPAP